MADISLDAYKKKIDQIANDSAKHDAELSQIDRRLGSIESSISDLARAFNQSQKTPLIPIITTALASISLIITIGVLALAPIHSNIGRLDARLDDTKRDLIARDNRNENELEEEIRISLEALKNRHESRIKELEKETDKHTDEITRLSNQGTSNTVKIEALERSKYGEEVDQYGGY